VLYIEYKTFPIRNVHFTDPNTFWSRISKDLLHKLLINM